ncbi:MAG: iron-sulfur cluster assembly protein [Kiritimatiellales bacterium]|nr:iron-sulfur cluster assembly protein [Kiritimatiellales bacterium]MCF7863553.1 iron-sulfur cluster assembly protein [Kiritimatiellales bacterium]
MFGKKKKERKLLKDTDNELFLKVVRSLRRVFDPEIPVNVYDLGLIYNLDIDEDNTVYVRMTLTAPNCPEAEQIPGAIYQAIKETEGVNDVDVELVFDPPWTREKMSTAALLALGLI